MGRYFKFLAFILFFVGGGSSAFAQEEEGVESIQIPDSTIKEIIIRTTPKQNLSGKVWDMGAYYYCKFSQDDERKAVLAGWILLDPYRREEIRSSVSAEHSIDRRDISIINAKENGRFGTYEVCVAGTKFTYVRRGEQYNSYRKFK